MTLSEAVPTIVYRVKSINGTDTVRIMEMGLTPDSELEVIRKAPLGFPLEIRVRGYLLSLRKEECDAIEVELV
jgi:ferrous iron transport protein A